jgi:predicted metal-dependent hydrolase
MSEQVRQKGTARVAVSKEAFKAEVLGWAVRMKVEPAEVHVRPMPRKWGSCSTRGRVSFSDDLLLESTEFREQIIVHELLHLKVPNHGQLFRSLLRAYLGRRELVDPARA